MDKHTVIPIELSLRELRLIEEALLRAASRLDSYGRFNPRNAKQHDDKAADMRKLRNRVNEALGTIGQCVKI